MQSFEPCFFVHEECCGRLTDYIAAIEHGLLQNRKAIPLFVESVVVLMVAWEEDFLGTLVATAAHDRQADLRDYLGTRGRPADKAHVATCDLPILISLARRQVHFGKRGQAIEDLFQRLFQVSPWPSDASRTRFVDLNLLRQIVIHHGGANVGDAYWDQLTDKALFDEKRYGDLPAIRRIAYSAALVLIRDIAVELLAQMVHLRAHLPK